ncbi:MAG TPA: hypothetical protein VEM39_07485 [Myxococcaceae bacterium]|nr:hypothetical protein [Myxococcaceae bacterium]
MSHSFLARFFRAIVGATLLSFSCAAFAWDTQAAMKKTSQASPGTVPPEGKAPAKETGSPAASRAGSKTSAQYGVEFVPGGIDRVILSKRDDAKNVCVQVTLASPGMADVKAPAGKVELPPNWSLERAIMVRDASACGGTLRRWPEGAIDATEVTGSVRWGSSPTEKTAFDLRLVFPAHGAAPAVTERLKFER